MFLSELINLICEIEKKYLSFFNAALLCQWHHEEIKGKCARYKYKCKEQRNGES